MHLTSAIAHAAIVLRRRQSFYAYLTFIGLFDVRHSAATVCLRLSVANWR